VSLLVPIELHDRLRQEASNERRSLNVLCQMLIERGLSAGAIQ